MNKDTIISVIICTFNRQEELKRFLETLNKQSQLPNELIIVDASKDYKTYELIENEMQSTKYLIKYIKTEPGLTRQRNIGIRKSNGKYIFFFDDDVVLDYKFIQVVYETFLDFEQHNIGGITGNATNISNKINLIDRLFKKLFFLTDYGKGKLKLSCFPAHRCDDKLSFVEVFRGFCMAYSRTVFSKHLFDESLSGYSYLEDVDFSYRVSKEYKLLYQPKAKLKHLATTFKKTDSRLLRRMMIQNHSYLFRKNLPPDISHLLAHFISILGIFLYNLIFFKDLKACLGIMEGFWYGTIRRQGPYDSSES